MSRVPSHASRARTAAELRNLARRVATVQRHRAFPETAKDARAGLAPLRSLAYVVDRATEWLPVDHGTWERMRLLYGLASRRYERVMTLCLARGDGD